MSFATNTPKITNCSNSGTIKATAGGNIGGIYGYANSKNNYIYGCSNTGAIINAASGSGGIVGYSNTGKAVNILGCYNAGTVSGVNNVGGVTGGIPKGTLTLTSCYNNGAVSTTSDSDVNLGGIYANPGDTTPTMTSCYTVTGTATATLVGSNGTEEEDVSISTLNSYVGAMNTSWGYDTYQYVAETVSPTTVAPTIGMKE
ncbi:MAG: hypothetical protein R3Y68_01525 [Rikenellaceae bacterium]